MSELAAPSTHLIVPVSLGEAAVGRTGTELVAFGLGSCIGLSLWSPRLRLGTLCHIVLPESGGSQPDPVAPAKYADWAVAWAIAALAARGARRTELVAKLAGGAQVLAFPLGTRIGLQNAAATVAALGTHGIPVAASSTGGNIGRTVRFYPGTGTMDVRPVGGTGVQL